MGQLRPLYCKHCCQTLLSDDLEKCGACGKVGGILDPADQAAVAEDAKLRAFRAARDQDSSERVLVNPVGQLISCFRVARWTIGGIGCLVMGVYLLVDPRMRFNPDRLTFDDAWPGLIAILVGVALLAMAYLPLLLRRPSRLKGKAEAEKPDGPV
jgi:hypothetical protein